MPGIPQNGRLHLLFHAQNLPKWAAKPPIVCFSGHEIKGVADHFGGFPAWIPRRSDFLRGPKAPWAPGPGAKRLFKGPKGSLGPERSDSFKGPKGPNGPLGPPVARKIDHLGESGYGSRSEAIFFKLTWQFHGAKRLFCFFLQFCSFLFIFSLPGEVAAT